VLVAFLLVTADLDRPTRGMIRIPDAVLVDQLESMAEPPAARAPRRLVSGLADRLATPAGGEIGDGEV
jgi:hypothetical protein